MIRRSAHNTDGPRWYYDKWKKPDKDKYHMISLLSGLKQRNRHRLKGGDGADRRKRQRRLRGINF